MKLLSKGNRKHRSRSILLFQMELPGQSFKVFQMTQNAAAGFDRPFMILHDVLCDTKPQSIATLPCPCLIGAIKPLEKAVQIFSFYRFSRIGDGKADLPAASLQDGMMPDGKERQNPGNVLNPEQQRPQEGGKKGDPELDGKTDVKMDGQADATAQTSADADAASAKGLKAGLMMILSGGGITIDASDDSIHCNGDIEIKDCTIRKHHHHQQRRFGYHRIR